MQVEVCGVSGELATDLCRKDALGYKTVKDYWRIGTEPRTECRMHRQLTLCATTGQIAGRYCPETGVKSVIVLPEGHALKKFRTTRYAGVLQDYLGEYALVDADNPEYSNNLCTQHTSAQWQPVTSGADEWRLRDARNLLAKAEVRLGTLDYASSEYAMLYYAITNMEGVLNASPDNTQLTMAMTQLTQAMSTVE